MPIPAGRERSRSREVVRWIPNVKDIYDTSKTPDEPPSLQAVSTAKLLLAAIK